MRDEQDDRFWIDNHARFSADVGRLLHQLAAVFRKLVAIEYEAPWEVEAKRKRGCC